jgi:hypothetical protein
MMPLEALVATATPLPPREGKTLLMILTTVRRPGPLEPTFVIFSTNLETALFARSAGKSPLRADSSVFRPNKIRHRKAKDADPVEFSSNIRFVYSQKTSTTSLRPHIEKYHRDLYLSLAKERGWKIQLPGIQSQARSQAASEIAALQAGQPDRLDQSTFHRYLVNFIVVDDQVRCRFYFVALLNLHFCRCGS